MSETAGFSGDDFERTLYIRQLELTASLQEIKIRDLEGALKLVRSQLITSDQQHDAQAERIRRLEEALKDAFLATCDHPDEGIQALNDTLLAALWPQS